ncbi:patched domain-containing protein 2-like [Sinocyclocheilus grahami]|uniref:patched domain-containing protein 2-like n=1 Tax=Sinocyclocheilus grahami TaxID=75366 RepID=UPI0007AD1C2A|nr:PREDICTED: patched domain-containing protein 2-like [Sinocyclocheilus grahami]
MRIPPIPAVHDFGLFMSLIVSCCWLWVSILMPAALCIWSQCGAAHANACPKWWTTLTKLSTSPSPLSDEDDVALITVEMEPGVYDSESDAVLLSLSAEAALAVSTEGSVGVVSAHLQKLLRHWVAEPVVEKRKTIIGGLLTVYVFKLELGSAVPLYRYSLSASVPAPWQASSSTHGDVPFFQAYRSPHSNFSTRISVCVSHAYHPRPRWMLTLRSCDDSRRWRSEFDFYVASVEQQHSRKLYFAQHTISPYPSRVCEGPPGCVFSSGPDGPTQGSFYAPLPTAPAQVKISRTSGFNPCSGGQCGKPAVRPLVDTGAMVFVVFGILGINRTQHSDNHVIGDLGSVIYDPDFDVFNEIGHLCKLCKTISANTKLVKPGGAQCLPSGNSLTSILPLLHPECHSLPEPNLLPGQLSHGAVGIQGGRVHWISMAFESTTYKGKSSFQTHSDFLQWESFLQKQLASIPASSALRRGFQTCQHWKQIFMEIIGKRVKIERGKDRKEL